MFAKLITYARKGLGSTLSAFIHFRQIRRLAIIMMVSLTAAWAVFYYALHLLLADHLVGRAAVVYLVGEAVLGPIYIWALMAIDRELKQIKAQVLYVGRTLRNANELITGVNAGHAPVWHGRELPRFASRRNRPNPFQDLLDDDLPGGFALARELARKRPRNLIGIRSRGRWG